jgi:hypothetical protein
MRIDERRCSVCGGRVQVVSAFVARVDYLCATHGEALHASPAFQLARVARTTAEAWRILDAWLERATWGSGAQLAA